MKTIKRDLILKKDTTFNESIKVEGSIRGDFNLKVVGNIDAGNIDAGNIDAGNIDAGNIDARDIICEKRIKKTEKARTFCRVFIQDKSKIKRKEW